MTESKGPSQGRLARTYRLARLATDTSARLALGMAKNAIGAGSDAASEDDLERHRKIAGRMAEILGNMKGLAMKAGQVLSYVDDWMPEHLRPTYSGVLGTLQAKAPKVPLAEMLNVFVDEVGEPPDEVFKEFDEEPIAAASIGQVYRATLPSGERVAVKIQYPGIAKAIESDLKNLDLLEAVMRASTLGRFDVTRSLQDIKTKITEELDYHVEAKNQQRFLELYRDHPGIVIPKVYEGFSSKRVLTTELLEGKTYQQLKLEPQAERDRVSLLLYEFVFGSFHRHGLFNADPHPGNYIFLPDGRVGFLDFGCVQQFPLDVPRNFQRLVAKLWAGDVATVRDGLPAALGYPGDASEEEKDFFFDYVTYLWTPILHDRPFRYDEAYTREVFKLTYSGVRLGAKVTMTKGYPDTEQRGLALLNRLQFGVASILGGLKAEQNWHRLLKTFFLHPEDIAPPVG
jgi:predicted unusual protein kinase regulating ubiquinone biosynthesis (AarF/ABC1/UbiB family)